jgi:hypothetical protein
VKNFDASSPGTSIFQDVLVSIEPGEMSNLRNFGRNAQ